jgi:hypothetical protein
MSLDNMKSNNRDKKYLSENTRKPYFILSVTDPGMQIVRPWSPKSRELCDAQFKKGGVHVVA